MCLFIGYIWVGIYMSIYVSIYVGIHLNILDISYK